MILARKTAVFGNRDHNMHLSGKFFVASLILFAGITASTAQEIKAIPIEPGESPGLQRSPRIYAHPLLRGLETLPSVAYSEQDVGQTLTRRNPCQNP
jgi:hypothetical protein